ncbi:MAG TPA: DNA polymerase III subunit delta [Xanthobacteraceae bacterium]|nr:DNA polymerase III subunit delta [Xanthobacteraceae bacterium]
MALLKSSEVESFVSRPHPARPVVLVCGSDAGMVSERIEALVRASIDDPRDGFAVTRIAGDELASDPAKILDEAQAIPMFGGRRVLWVRAGARSFVAAIEAVLKLSMQECRIIIEAGDLKRNAPLRALCERAPNAAVIACYADTARDLERLIDEEMRAAGLSIAADARAALLSLIGGDRRASRNELRKLALFAQGRKSVELDDVLAVVSDASALALDEIVDAAFAGNAADLETRFAQASASGTAAGAIIGSAIRHVAQLHKMRLAIEAGGSADEMIRQYRIHFRREAAITAALRQWTAPRLAQAMNALAQAALDIRRNPALGAAIGQRALTRIARATREQKAA